jgi:3'5'-cyclic nucleotide phosphodiesterase
MSSSSSSPSATNDDGNENDDELILFLSCDRGVTALAPGPAPPGPKQSPAAIAAASGGIVGGEAAGDKDASSSDDDNANKGNKDSKNPRSRYSIRLKERMSVGSNDGSWIFNVTDSAGKSYPQPGYGVVIVKAKLMLSPSAVDEVNAIRKKNNLITALGRPSSSSPSSSITGGDGSGAGASPAAGYTATKPEDDATVAASLAALARNFGAIPSGPTAANGPKDSGAALASSVGGATNAPLAAAPMDLRAFAARVIASWKEGQNTSSSSSAATAGGAFLLGASAGGPSSASVAAAALNASNAASGGGQGNDGTTSPLLIEDDFHWVLEPLQSNSSSNDDGKSPKQGGEGRDSVASGKSGSSGGSVQGGGAGGNQLPNARPTLGTPSFSTGGTLDQPSTGRLGGRPVSARFGSMRALVGGDASDAGQAARALQRGSIARVGSMPLLSTAGGAFGRGAGGSIASSVATVLGSSAARRSSAFTSALTPLLNTISGDAGAAGGGAGGAGGAGVGGAAGSSSGGRRPSLAASLVGQARSSLANAAAAVASGDPNSQLNPATMAAIANALSAGDFSPAVVTLARILAGLTGEVKRRRSSSAGANSRESSGGGDGGSGSSSGSGGGLRSKSMGAITATSARNLRPTKDAVGLRTASANDSSDINRPSDVLGANGAIRGKRASKVPYMDGVLVSQLANNIQDDDSDDGSTTDEEEDENDSDEHNEEDEFDETAVLPSASARGSAYSNGRRRLSPQVETAVADPFKLLKGLPTHGDVPLPASRINDACNAIAGLIQQLTLAANNMAAGGGGGVRLGGGNQHLSSSAAQAEAETTNMVLSAMKAMDVDEQSKRWLASEYMKGDNKNAAGDDGSSNGSATGAKDSDTASVPNASGAAPPPPPPHSSTPSAPPKATASSPAVAPAPAPAAASGGHGHGAGSASNAGGTPAPGALGSVHLNRVLNLNHQQRTLMMPGDLIAGPGSDSCSTGWLGWGLSSIVGVSLGAVPAAAAGGAAAAEGAPPAPIDEGSFVIQISEAELKRRHRVQDDYDRIYYEDAEDRMHGPFSARQMVTWVDESYMPIDSGIRVGAPTNEPVSLEVALPQLRVRSNLARAREMSLDAGSIDSWTFDIWKLQTDEPSQLLPICSYIACRLRLPRFFNLQPGATEAFFADVCKRMSLYSETNATPYHNFYHAVDVMQTVNALLVQMNAGKLFTPVETLAVVIGALCHDLEHPGVNNAYLINSGDDLALRYNDQSVLEAHHAAVCSQLLAKHKLVEGLSKPQHKEFRRVCLASILATDMTCHFSLTDELKNVGLSNAHRIRYLLSSSTSFHHRPAMTRNPGNGTGAGGGSGVADEDGASSSSSSAAHHGGHYGGHKDARLHDAASGHLAGTAEELADISPADRLIMLKNFMHAADISNPTKPWNVSKAWSDRVLEEFFNQGDRERKEGLPLSPNTDRATVKQPQMTVNFIDFVVAPLFIALSAMLPGAQLCVDILNENRTIWSNKLKEDIEQDNALATSDAKNEAKKKWERRDTVFRGVLMPLVAASSADEVGNKDKDGGDEASSEDADEDGWGDDDDDNGNSEDEEVAATARVLSLNALETFAAVAAAKQEAGR